MKSVQARPPCWFLAILLALLFNGCAGKQPWTTSQVAEEEAAFLRQTFEEMQQRDASCFASLDAEATLVWAGPASKRSVTGFLQLMLPTALKFIVLNPLGQPLYALVSDGREFQSINTSLKQHTIGQIGTLAAQYQIPASLLSDDWGYWLTGRLHEHRATIEAIRRDGSGRGIWLTLRYQGASNLPKNHLLIQPESKQLLTRILVDHQGETIATISYDQRDGQEACSPPSRITISDLPYRSQLTIDFTDILTDRSFTTANFKLKVPADFTTQELR
jgi:outer membrane lipoprotein-sorting protein